jgi:hypothetical protein
MDALVWLLTHLMLDAGAPLDDDEIEIGRAPRRR